MKHLGVLERWWAVEWARFRATVYVMFHLGCRVHIENTWREVRGTRNDYGENDWVEHITYIAVIKGTIIKQNLVVVKEYFGESRYPLELFNANTQKE